MGVEERVLQILAEKLGVAKEELLPELSLDMLALDSLDWLELLVALEEAFDVSLDEGAFLGCDSLAQVAALISAALQA